MNFGVEYVQDDNDNDDKNIMGRAMNENETACNGDESKNTNCKNIDYYKMTSMLLQVIAKMY